MHTVRQPQLDQFLRQLRETPRDWTFDHAYKQPNGKEIGEIRRHYEKDGMRYRQCPMTAVSGHDSIDFGSAIDKIGFTYDEGRQIAAAADGTRYADETQMMQPFDQTLRNLLLEACGLPIEDVKEGE